MLIKNLLMYFSGQSWNLTYLPNYPGKDRTFAVGEESPYYTYGYILAKANTDEGKVVFQGPWMEPYKKVQQFSSNPILDAQFRPGNSDDMQQYPTGGQPANGGFQNNPTEADIVEVEWNTEEASSV